MSSSPAVSESPKRRGCAGCLRRGCCGCLVALLVLVVAAAGAAFFLRPGPEQRETLLAEPEAAAALSGPGKVILELEAGDFRIVAGPPGFPSAEATADVATTELEQSFARAEDGTWSWHVRYGNSLGPVSALLASGREAGRVTVRLPPDVPIDLELRLSKGATDADLGGLHLTRMHADLSTGDHRIRFSEPLVAALPSLSVRSRFGETRIDGIGNASPLLTHVESAYGETALGLDGAWQQPATVSADFKMGALRLTAPADLRLVRGDVSVNPGNVSFPPLLAPDVSVEGAPEIRLDVRGRFGEAQLETTPR